MQVISTRSHGVLDYATVAGFSLLPLLFGLSGTPMYLSYSLAGIHLLMTVMTNFPLGIFRIIPIGPQSRRDCGWSGLDRISLDSGIWRERNRT